MTSLWLLRKKELALGMLRDGTGYADVGRAIDLPAETVRRWCHEAGIPAPRRYRMHSFPFRRLVIRRVQDGESMAEIARSLDIAQSLVSVWCQQAQVESKFPPGRPVVEWYDVLLCGVVEERVRRVGSAVMRGRRRIGQWQDVERCRPRVSKDDAGRDRWQDGPAARREVAA